jgi:hypothetical protein
MGKALAGIVKFYKWDAVAVIYEDTDWGKDAGAQVISFLKSDNANMKILNEGDGEFAADDLADNAINTTTEDVKLAKADLILSKLEESGAKIVVVAVEPKRQRLLFSQSYTSDKMYGEGFAWVSAWPDDAMYTKKDGSIDLAAMHGAAGVLSILPGNWAHNNPGQGNPETEAYVDLWKEKVKVEESCADSRLQPALADKAYCDADGDRDTFSSYARNMVDTIVAFAKGVDKLARNNADPRQQGRLYTTLVDSDKYLGMSGTIKLDEHGDLLGDVTIVNLEFENNEEKDSSLTLTKKKVGVYEALIDNLNMTIFEEVVRFSGNSQNIPSTNETEKGDEKGDEKADATVATSVWAVVGVAIFSGIFWFIHRIVHRARTNHEIVNRRHRLKVLAHAAPESVVAGSLEYALLEAVELSCFALIAPLMAQGASASTRDKEMQLPLTRLLGTPPGDQTPKDQHVNKRAHQGRHDHINTNELCSLTQFPDSDDDRTAAAYVLLAGHCEFDLTLGLAMAEQGFVDAISEEENNHKNARRTSTGRFMDTIREEDKRKKNARSIGHVIGPNGKITMTSGIVSKQTSSHPPPIALQCAITVIIVMPYFLIHLSFSHHNKISCRV